VTKMATSSPFEPKSLHSVGIEKNIPVFSSPCSMSDSAEFAGREYNAKQGCLG
jgi:hypothetical protein